MVDFKNGAIILTRGDNVQLNLTIYENNSTKKYDIKDTDEIKFFLVKDANKKANFKSIFTKTFSKPAEGETTKVVSTHIKEEDTMYLNGNDYMYFIVLSHTYTQEDGTIKHYSETITYGRFIIEL